MYTVEKVFDNRFNLYYGTQLKGVLYMFEEEARVFARVLNTHPLID